MRTKDLIDLADDPNLISGIHNYCDRWCERCPFTARCLVYATERADEDADPASRDISNAAFWEKLASIFAETQEMISTLAAENGIDLSPGALEPLKKQEEKRQAEGRSHLLAKVAEKYASDVSEWFSREFAPTEIISDAAPGTTVETVPDDDTNDYVEVIRWYQFFIPAKIIRGLTSRIDEDEYLADDDARDSDGSTKAALIAIDRSLTAWRLLSEARPENADSISGLLLDLEKLRLGVEREFPRARDFIRPGFDEPSLDMLH